MTDASASAVAAPSRRLRAFRLLAGIALLLLVVRLLLPWLLARAVNHRLGALPAHLGVVGDVDLRLFRGAYRLHNLSLRRRGPDAEPMLSVRTVDFSLAWRELLRGRVVSDIVLEAPILHLFRAGSGAPSETDPARATSEDWRDLIRDLFPIEITRLDIRDGKLAYVDAARDPPLDLALHELDARVEGLANRARPPADTHPARGELRAAVEGGGRLVVRARGDPLARPPRFDLEAEAEEVSLPVLNPLLRGALGVDVSAGLLHVSAEFTTAEGQYGGYVKPLVRGARFEDVGRQAGGPVKTLWETIVGATSSLLTNDETRSVGLRIPFTGEFGRGDVDAWAGLLTLLRNGFGRALREGVEENVASGA